MSSLTTGRAFATSPCRARTTIEEIILNLNMRREEEKKRTVLASSRKRVDIIYRLTTGRAFATSPCGIRTTIEEIILILFMKKIFISEIPVRRRMLSVSPANNI